MLLLATETERPVDSQFGHTKACGLTLNLYFFTSKTKVMRNLFHNGFVGAPRDDRHHTLTPTAIIRFSDVKRTFLYFKKLHFINFLMVLSSVSWWNPNPNHLGPGPRHFPNHVNCHCWWDLFLEGQVLTVELWKSLVQEMREETN